MNRYEAYKNQQFDLLAFGIERRADLCSYFCTPVGAEIIGWTGVDGIHYCLIPGLGEMVFAISPMNDPGKYVHPVAKSFDDFLRLLLACHGNAAIEQCWQWSKEQFENFLTAEQLCGATNEAARLLSQQTGLTPLKQPYAYICQLQKTFNDRLIPYGEEYYNLLAEETIVESDDQIAHEQAVSQWAVYFEGNFWTKEHTDMPCQEVAIEKHFHWAGREWYIPSLYICEQGLVVDMLMRVDVASMQRFLEKWHVTTKNEHSFTPEQRRQMAAENPLAFHFRLMLHDNGEELSPQHSCATTYMPSLTETEDELPTQIISHYHLSPLDGWAIYRSTYAWTATQQRQITNLAITVTHQPNFLPGATFVVKAANETHTFINPVTNIQHTLSVQEFKSLHHPHGQFATFPSHYILMTFSLEPDLPQSQFAITDSLESDIPPNQPGKGNGLNYSYASSIGIIGGADGPTAILCGAPNEANGLHATCSSLRFAPITMVKWQTSFRAKQKKAITVTLI